MIICRAGISWCPDQEEELFLPWSKCVLHFVSITSITLMSPCVLCSQILIWLYVQSGPSNPDLIIPWSLTPGCHCHTYPWSLVHWPHYAAPAPGHLDQEIEETSRIKLRTCNLHSSVLTHWLAAAGSDWHVDFQQLCVACPSRLDWLVSCNKEIQICVSPG